MFRVMVMIAILFVFTVATVSRLYHIKKQEITSESIKCRKLIRFDKMH